MVIPLLANQDLTPMLDGTQILFRLLRNNAVRLDMIGRDAAYWLGART